MSDNETKHFSSQPDLALGITTDVTIRTESRTPMQVVADTWEELGRRFRPLHKGLFVRTDPMAIRTAGGLFLTGEESAFHKGMGHNKVIKATILSVAKDVPMKEGERVCFQRLHFTWIWRLRDGTYVGIIRDDFLIGHLENEDLR